MTPTRNDSGLPKAPTNFAPYEEWVRRATDHLSNAVDTAIDELQRDRDFLHAPLLDELSPDGETRELCREEAIRRFVARVIGEQEG